MVGVASINRFKVEEYDPLAITPFEDTFKVLK